MTILGSHTRRDASGRIARAAAALALLVASGCDESDRARIPEEVVIQKPTNLSPPRVEGPIHECAEAVHVTGFASGAIVRVYVGTEEVGSAVPHFGFADIELTRALELGEAVAASQTVNAIESAKSIEPVVVEAWPPNGQLPKPDVGDELYACGRIVPVGNLLESVRVKVTEDGAIRAQADAPGSWKAVFTNTGLTGGGAVSARAIACEGDPAREIVSEPADDVTVLAAPADMRVPIIDPDTVIVGNDAVVIDNLYVGADVKVLDVSGPLGGGFATARRNHAPLHTPIGTDQVAATQALCEESDRSDAVTPSTSLPAPTLLGPLCNDDLTVVVRDTVLNATVAIKADGNVVALGGASASGTVELDLGTSLVPGQTVEAVQFMGNNVSAPSGQVSVCCCTQECWVDERRKIDDPEWTTSAPLACAAPTSPLYNAPSNDFIELELQADFDHINDPGVSKPDAFSSGTLSWVEGGSPQSVAVTVEARGNSRFNHCAFRPLRIVFPSEQVGNVFEGVTRRLKVVTHCGTHPTDPWILGGPPEVQRRRLLAEFYFYEVLERLNSTALNTRLARITYKRPDDSVVITEFAVLREREDAACERCGLIDEVDDGDFGTLTPNETSVFQGTLYNRFVFNEDFDITSGHNTRGCFDAALNGFYIPYDWDLTGVVRPDYVKNDPHAPYTDNVTRFQNFLVTTPPEARMFVQVWHMVQQDGAMEDVLSDTLLDAQGEALLQDWYRLYMNSLKCWLGSVSVGNK